MAVRIRMQRMGAKRKPFYRIVVADSRVARDGKIIEQIGTYDPVAKGEDNVKLDHELALKWLNNGAQPSDTVRSLLSDAGIMKQYHEAKYTK